jgi:hypothetical protein
MRPLTLFGCGDDLSYLTARTRGVVGMQYSTTVTQVWQWQNGEAAVLLRHGRWNFRDYVVVMRRGLRRGEPEVHEVSTGIAPLLEALTQRPVRVGVRRGPRPMVRPQLALLRRHIRAVGRRFRILRPPGH